VLGSPALYELSQLSHHGSRIERARCLTAGMQAGVDVDAVMGLIFGAGAGASLNRS
jgi:hypothetical protein